MPGTPNAGELILALKSAAGGRRLHQRLGPGRRVRRAQPVRAGHLPRPRRDRRERQRAVGVRRRHVRPGVVPVRRDAQAVRPVQPAGPAQGRGLRRGPGVRVRRARRRHQAAHRGAAPAGRARRRPGPAGRRRSRGAAHGGAQAVAQHAKDELDARVGAADRRTSTRSSPPCRGCPATPDAVSAAAVALAGDLQPLLDAIGVPGVPAARPLGAGEAGADPEDAHRPRQGRRRSRPDARGRRRRTGHRADAVAAGRSSRGACRGAPNIFKPQRRARPAHRRRGARRRRARRRRSTSSPRSSTSTSTSSATAPAA